LGHSPMARRFAISSREEAVAYLGHGVLGPRLRECTALVNAVEGRTIREILGSPDDLKFCSSMTLFGAVASDAVFAAAIAKFCGGRPDPRTLELLGAKPTRRSRDRENVFHGACNARDDGGIASNKQSRNSPI